MARIGLQRHRKQKLALVAVIYGVRLPTLVNNGPAECRFGNVSRRILLTSTMAPRFCADVSGYDPVLGR